MNIKTEVISSRSNPFVKWAASLLEKKGRAENKSFILEGEKLTFEAFEKGLPLTHVIIEESKLEKNLEKLERALSKTKNEKPLIKVVTESVFEKISTEKAPQGVISIVKYLDFFSKVDIIYKEEFFISEGERALFLYSLRDPVNLGSVIRCAAAFGIDHLVLSSDCADVYNPRTVRCAMGSLFGLKITVVSDSEAFVRTARECGRRVFAAELREGATSLSDVGLLASDVIVIGNEGHGISPEISALCDSSVYIPISDGTESLNASCAAAVFMWEQSKARF